MWDKLVTGFESFVGTVSGGNDLIGDAVNGALFGAITTAVGGGDILEGAAWGAAGNAISGSGDDGIFNIAGRGIAGYGIDKALGGDGLIGGAGGLLAGYLEGDDTQQTAAKPEVKAGEGDTTNIEAPAASSPGMMEKYGLQNAEGDGTLLGKALVSAAGYYGASKEREDQLEQVEKLRARSRRDTKELDEEFEQKKLAGFRQPSMIVRNG